MDQTPMLSQTPQEIHVLIKLLSGLPGLGPRSARRAVLALLKKRDEMMTPLAEALLQVAHNVRDCPECGNITTVSLGACCHICADSQRNRTEICVVEGISDLWAIERTGVFDGYYHVLGGTLSPLDAIGPDQLRIPKLLERVKALGVSEVILALNATVDGQTTAYYLADALAGQGVRVTTLAQGVPIGGELNFLDDGTIGAALRSRHHMG